MRKGWDAALRCWPTSSGRWRRAATSGLPSFERTRGFYRLCGYDEEARIRDFYQAGEDKIVFRKALEGTVDREKGVTAIV